MLPLNANENILIELNNSGLHDVYQIILLRNFDYQTKYLRSTKVAKKHPSKR